MKVMMAYGFIGPLGRNWDTIIAHFSADSDVDYIMLRTSNLKGTKYVVHRDYPSEVRWKRAYLMAVRAEIEEVARMRRMPLVVSWFSYTFTGFISTLFQLLSLSCCRT